MIDKTIQKTLIDSCEMLHSQGVINDSQLDLCLSEIDADKYGKSIQITDDDSLVVNRSLNADKFHAATGYVTPEWPELIRIMFNYK